MRSLRLPKKRSLPLEWSSENGKRKQAGMCRDHGKRKPEARLIFRPTLPTQRRAHRSCRHHKCFAPHNPIGPSPAFRGKKNRPLAIRQPFFNEKALRAHQAQMDQDRTETMRPRFSEEYHVFREKARKEGRRILSPIRVSRSGGMYFQSTITKRIEGPEVSHSADATDGCILNLLSSKSPLRGFP